MDLLNLLTLNMKFQILSHWEAYSKYVDLQP